MSKLSKQSEKRICKTCKHCFSDPDHYYKCCKHPKNVISSVDLISGKTRYVYRYSFCKYHRNMNTVESFLFRTCGKKGKWYERK